MTDRLPQVPATYDAMYLSGGHDGVYDLPYRHSRYYPLFREVLAELRRRRVRSVLEVGCGVGVFASMIFDRSDIDYHGFDFSPVAVAKAIERTRRNDAFAVGDATDPGSYTRAYSTIVCTEVLEHIEPDRQVVATWAPGTYCICSVPNFDSSTHVRYFTSEEDVRERYGDLIDIHSMKRIKSPFLTDLSWQSYARAILWNRYRPSRLLNILGWSRFEEGGWFLFSGERRTR